MCLVSEELSRAYIGVGSLGTRSEIAGELIRVQQHAGAEGTLASRHRLGRRCCRPRSLPGQCRLRPRQPADPCGQGWRRLSHLRREDLDHPRRALRPDDLAGANRRARQRLSRPVDVSRAEAARGDDANPFPAEGMSGTEIPVLGYRGMKEYEIGFDGFAVPRDCLPARRGRRRGLQATDGDLRERPGADRRPRRRQGSRRMPSNWRWAMPLERRQFGRNLAAIPARAIGSR